MAQSRKTANEITGIPLHRSTRMLLPSSSGLFNHHRFTPWLYSRKNCIARCGMMDIWLRNRQVLGCTQASWFLLISVIYAETDPISRTDQQGGGQIYFFIPFTPTTPGIAASLSEFCWLISIYSTIPSRTTSMTAARNPTRRFP